MTKEEFTTSLIGQVKKYIYLADEYGENAQIKVNPRLLLVDLLTNKEYQQAIEFSDEVVENAAYAEGDETMSSEDYQATQNPDFYPIELLINRINAHTLEPNYTAIDTIVKKYFR